MAKYHMRRGGQIHGPYSLDQLITAAKSGKLQANDEVASDKNGPWLAAGKLPQLASLYSAATAPPPTQPAAVNTFDFGEDFEGTPMPFRPYQTTLSAKPPAAYRSAGRSRPASSGQTDEEGSFFLSLFDWKFENFITPTVNRFLYGLVTMLWLLTVVLFVVAAEISLTRIEGPFKLPAMLLVPPIAIVLWFLVQVSLRNACELALVLFRIEENTRSHR